MRTYYESQRKPTYTVRELHRFRRSDARGKRFDDHSHEETRRHTRLKPHATTERLNSSSTHETHRTKVASDLEAATCAPRLVVSRT
jgi:hypothetical protein